jgi:chromosome segregation ATPase
MATSTCQTLSDDPIPTAPDLDTRGSALENEKLYAEIAKAKADKIKSDLEAAELRKPWYQKPAILQPLATIAVAVLTAIIGYANGWFQTKLESLHNAEDKLQIRVDELKERRSALDVEIDHLNHRLQERDDLNHRLQEALAAAEKLQQETSEKAVQGEQWHQQVDVLAKQLKQAISEADAIKAKAGANSWHVGDTVQIEARNAETGVQLSDYEVAYPLTEDEDKRLRSNGIYTGFFERVLGLGTRKSEWSACLKERDGTCEHDITKAALILGHVRIEVSSRGYVSKTFVIPNGTRQFSASLTPQ